MPRVVGNRGEAVSISFDETELKELITSMDSLRDAFGNSHKMTQIARDASRPLVQYMKQTAPKNSDKRYIKPKRHWKSYKPGALKRSIGSWTQYGGILVGARFGKRAKDISSDGWYVHLAHNDHKVKGGKTVSGYPFIDHAVAAMGGTVKKLIMENAKRVLDGLW
tara:strand:+ start:172 stop:666 length:495 start_codon:yes stop_codon:yes gene_type:complete